jgi:DNA transposition AAA+ family ATPase
MDEWENCVRYVPGEHDESGIELVWLGLAKERLAKGNRQ